MITTMIFLVVTMMMIARIIVILTVRAPIMVFAQ